MRLAVIDLGSWIRPHWIRRIENGQKILEKGKITENIGVKVVFDLRPRCHKQLCFYKSVFPFLRFEHSREGPQTCYLRAIRDTYLDNINMNSVFRHFNRRKFCQTLLLSLLKIHFTSAIVPEIGENFPGAALNQQLTSKTQPLNLAATNFPKAVRNHHSHTNILSASPSAGGGARAKALPNLPPFVEGRS